MRCDQQPGGGRHSDAGTHTHTPNTFLNNNTGDQETLDRLATGNLTVGDLFEGTAPVGYPPRCRPGYFAVNTPNAVYVRTINGQDYHIECGRVSRLMKDCCVCACGFKKGGVGSSARWESTLSAPRWAPAIVQLRFVQAALCEVLSSCHKDTAEPAANVCPPGQARHGGGSRLPGDAALRRPARCQHRNGVSAFCYCVEEWLTVQLRHNDCSPIALERGACCSGSRLSTPSSFKLHH